MSSIISAVVSHGAVPDCFVGLPGVDRGASTPVAGGNPVMAPVFVITGVEVYRLCEVGGYLFTGGKSTAGECIAEGGVGVMVEVVVVGAVDRVPCDDSGGILEAPGQVGGDEGNLRDRSGGAFSFQGGASSVVAGRNPVIVTAAGTVGVDKGSPAEVGGHLFAEHIRPVGLHVARGGEVLVMVETVGVGAVDRIPAEDNGGAFVRVDQVGWDQRNVHARPVDDADRHVRAVFGIQVRAALVVAGDHPVVVPGAGRVNMRVRCAAVHSRQLLARDCAAKGRQLATGVERVVMVNDIVFGVSDRIPTDDDGIALNCVGETGWRAERVVVWTGGVQCLVVG